MINYHKLDESINLSILYIVLINYLISYCNLPINASVILFIISIHCLSICLSISTRWNNCTTDSPTQTLENIHQPTYSISRDAQKYAQTHAHPNTLPHMDFP